MTKMQAMTYKAKEYQYFEQPRLSCLPKASIKPQDSQNCSNQSDHPFLPNFTSLHKRHDYINQMDNSEILKQIQTIQKEGECQKQSRFLKSWRKRWIVLTANLLLTYKERRVYQSPTEVIQLKEVVSIKTTDEESDKSNVFKIETNETTFYFSCESSLEKEQWIGAIGKAMVKRNTRDYDD